jgi:hypothetical protein
MRISWSLIRQGRRRRRRRRRKRTRYLAGSKIRIDRLIKGNEDSNNNLLHRWLEEMSRAFLRINEQFEEQHSSTVRKTHWIPLGRSNNKK